MNFLKKLFKSHKYVSHESGAGFIFLEILIAVALVGLVFITLLGIGAQSLMLSSSIKKTTEINALLREELEAVRSFRDGTEWSVNGLGVINTGNGNSYHLILDNTPNPPNWMLQSGTEAVGAYTRKTIFDKVSRNPATQDIESAYNPTNDDPGTRKITASIAYDGKTYEVITYLTNWQNN